MTYINAHKVLPEELIMEIQKYVQGKTLYIPKPESERLRWGASSGGREMLDCRNEEIRESFANGSKIEELAEVYHLSPETIKKVVYTSK